MSKRESELVSLRKADTDDEEEEELLIKKSHRVVRQPTEDDLLLESSTLDDVLAALNDAKYIAPLVALCVLLVGMYLTTDIFRPVQESSPRLSHEEFKDIRPVLTVKEMANIYVSTMYAETQFKLPEPWYDDVALKFSTVTDRHGHHHPPEVFFSGVVYGISAANPHHIEFSESRRRLQDGDLLAALKSDLQKMVPAPTSIFERYAENNDTSFNDRGYAIYFSLDDLKEQGMLSSDSHEPWKRTLEPVLKVARSHKQVYITQWYPKKFGRQDVTAVLDNAHRHETVIRQIIPTRTGLNNIKSTAAVWLMSTNFTAPTITEVGIKKQWTEDDHWSHYPVDSGGEEVSR